MHKPHTYKERAVIRQERFDTPGQVELTIENKLGDVRLMTHATPVTEVELRREGSYGDEIIENARVELRKFDGNERVIVEVPERPGFLWRKDTEVVVTVRLPEGASIDVATASGKITAEGTLGGARVRTASGNISLGPVEGDLVARTASGDVTVASVAGVGEMTTASGSVRCGPLGKTALVKTASGDVDLGSVAGRMTAETASGDIAVGGLRDGCDFKTVSGDQRVRQLVAGRADFKTVSGDLTISVARGTAVMVDVESLSGSLNSEISLSDAPVADGPDEQAGPRAELRARSVSGDIRVRRAPA
jgi:DUF4097 and DUF4098 domain-containing protein YvlB